MQRRHVARIHQVEAQAVRYRHKNRRHVAQRTASTRQDRSKISLLTGCTGVPKHHDPPAAMIRLAIVSTAHDSCDYRDPFTVTCAAMSCSGMLY